jgi:hypothetical protein
MPAADNAPIVTLRSRADLRAWLTENHATAKVVRLASGKKPRPDDIAHEPQAEKLLCRR